MSIVQADPAEGLEITTESLAEHVIGRLEKLSEDAKDLLYYYSEGASLEEIAKALNISDTRYIQPRINGILRSFLLPETLSESERRHIIEQALEIFDAKSKSPAEHVAAVLPAKAQQPVHRLAQPPVAPRPASAPPTAPPVTVTNADPAAPALMQPVSTVPVLETRQEKRKPVVEVKGLLVSVPIEQLRRFEGQPRTEFDPQTLTWLSKSIARVGQLQPALLRKLHGVEGIEYEIIDGECRWIAAKSAGLTTFDGIEYPGLTIEDAKSQYRVSVISNFGRSRHTPLELAYAAQKLISDDGSTPVEVAEALCMHEVTIRNHLRLLRLVPEVQALMRIDIEEKKRLTISHALKLVDYPAEFQVIVADEIVEKKLSGNKTPWYIRLRASELGVTAQRSRKGRRPAGDARNLQRALERFEATTEQYRNLPGTSITEIFQGRIPTERAQTVVIIQRLIESLQNLQASIEEAQPSGE